MKLTIPSRIALLAAFLFTLGACNRSPAPLTADQSGPTPSAEDIRIGRQAISVNEVSLLAQNGFHKDAVATVLRRHIPEEMTAEEELKLRGFAKPELIAAMKDPQNILTPPQKDAYDEAKGKQLVHKQQAANVQSLQANTQRQQNSVQVDQAWTASVAEQQEAQRRERANGENAFAAEQSKAERAAREREQLRSVEARWRNMDAQNSYHRPYNTPVPVRPYSYPRN
jgi:hypothetical protein